MTQDMCGRGDGSGSRRRTFLPAVVALLASLLPAAATEAAAAEPTPTAATEAEKVRRLVNKDFAVSAALSDWGYIPDQALREMRGKWYEDCRGRGVLYVLEHPEEFDYLPELVRRGQGVPGTLANILLFIAQLDEGLDGTPLLPAVRNALNKLGPEVGGVRGADIRGRAAQALGRIGTRDDIPALLELLSDEYPSPRYAAARTLAWLGEPADAEKIEEIARRRRRRLEIIECRDASQDGSIRAMEKGVRAIRERHGLSVSPTPAPPSSPSAPPVPAAPAPAPRWPLALGTGLGGLVIGFALAALIFRRRRA